MEWSCRCLNASISPSPPRMTNRFLLARPALPVMHLDLALCVVLVIHLAILVSVLQRVKYNIVGECFRGTWTYQSAAAATYRIFCNTLTAEWIIDFGWTGTHEWCCVAAGRPRQAHWKLSLVSVLTNVARQCTCSSAVQASLQPKFYAVVQNNVWSVIKILSSVHSLLSHTALTLCNDHQLHYSNSEVHWHDGVLHTCFDALCMQLQHAGLCRCCATLCCALCMHHQPLAKLSSAEPVSFCAAAVQPSANELGAARTLGW